VNTWSTDLRYATGTIPRGEAEEFLQSAAEIIKVDRRKGVAMAAKTKTANDDTVIRTILNSLAGYKRSHPKAEVEAYRENPVSVRLRIVDLDFEGQGLVDREKAI
jgi:hypothetical protein